MSRMRPITSPMPTTSLRHRRLHEDLEVISKLSLGDEVNYDPETGKEDYAKKYIDFTDSAPTKFHAIDYLSEELEEAGFVYLSERDSWDEELTRGSRFYTIRNGASLVAFVRGRDWTSEKGCAITGTHIDSLTVLLKPTSLKSPIENFELIGVAPYSGGLNETWWDRDLGIGGRLIVRKKTREGTSIATVLVRIPHPVARIATLAPHFGTPSSGPFNPETQKVPFVGLVSNDDKTNLKPTKDESRSPLVGKHSLRLLRALAREAGVPVGDILDIELNLFDTQAATLAGLDKEFLFAPRIDDKACSYTAVHGLIEAADTIEEGSSLGIVAAYDFEEVGSLARTGARGNLLESTVDRLLGDETGEATRAQFWANSFFLSADVTHAVNPNFNDIYLEHHKPQLNRGMTLSFDPNGNMITDSVSAAFVREVARRTGNTLQQFQIRNDSRSGGTIGPALASKIGVRGVDIGIAQLSMHSVRAAIGSEDIWLAVRFFKSFYSKWQSVDEKFRRGGL